jgi:lipopolysaccharide transport system ATP-binding protein
MSSEVVIRSCGLGKAYQIFARPEDRLKQILFGRWKRFYREFWALSGADLEIRRGETIGVIGRNGSGKSTFLQLVCGTLQATTGSLEVSGRIAALLELGAGFNPEFTGRENVYLAATLLGLSRQQIDERFAAIEEFAGIGDFIDQPVKLYSSGMYARLAFAVSAHVDADILIVDEILAVGDAAFTQKCMRYIHAFKAKGTLLFVSHDTASVVALCDRAIWLDSGSVREIGPAKEVCHNYIAAINQENDNRNTFKIGGSRKSPPESTINDPRHELLQQTTLRNDIQVFEFNHDAPWFGHRGASIEGVTLRPINGSSSAVFSGGEPVELEVSCSAQQEIFRPIVGFFIKDKLGQYLFGDNTFLTYQDAPMFVARGDLFSARFRFQLPYLPTGDYSVLVAIAEGTQESHIQHHWVDEALFFRVHASHVARGLIGVPMLEILLQAPVRPSEAA